MSHRTDWKQWRRGLAAKRPDWPSSRGKITLTTSERKRRAAVKKARHAPKPKPQPQLFAGPVPAVAVAATLHFDGGCAPNPGRARCGYSLQHPGGTIERSVDLGWGTNNVAEYNGLIHGLKAALAAGITELDVLGDSQLVIGGMKRGPSRKGMPHLETLKQQALDLARQFHRVTFTWVPRERNERANRLATRHG